MRSATPGPWRACTEKGDIPQTLYGGIIALLMDSGEEDGYIAVIRANGDRADGWCPESLIHETMVSNAYLIAAAPILKEALIQISVLAYDASTALDPGGFSEAHIALGQITDVIHNALAAATPPAGGSDATA